MQHFLLGVVDVRRATQTVDTFRGKARVQVTNADTPALEVAIAGGEESKDRVQPVVNIL